MALKHDVAHLAADHHHHDTHEEERALRLAIHHEHELRDAEVAAHAAAHAHEPHPPEHDPEVASAIEMVQRRMDDLEAKENALEAKESALEKKAEAAMAAGSAAAAAAKAREPPSSVGAASLPLSAGSSGSGLTGGLKRTASKGASKWSAALVKVKGIKTKAVVVHSHPIADPTMVLEHDRLLRALVRKVNAQGRCLQGLVADAEARRAYEKLLR